MTDTIIAIDLGRHNSVACVYQRPTRQHSFRTLETTPEALIVVLDSGPVSIPWEMCSERLAHASQAERDRAELSPSGYGIHWPLIDEDLAVGPLVRTAA